jgi:hypothetical protein
MPELLTISKRFLEWAQALPETVIPAGLESDMQEAIAREESQLTRVAADFEACPADHAKLQAMRLAPKFCPACGVRLQSR